MEHFQCYDKSLFVLVQIQETERQGRNCRNLLFGCRSMMWWAVSTFYIQSFCNNFEFSFLVELLFPLGRLGFEVTLFLRDLWPSLIRINVNWTVRLGPVCLPVTLVVSILLVWLDQVQQQALELYPMNGRYRHILFRAVYMEGGKILASTRKIIEGQTPLTFCWFNLQKF